MNKLEFLQTSDFTGADQSAAEGSGSQSSLALAGVEGILPQVRNRLGGMMQEGETLHAVPMQVASAPTRVDYALGLFRRLAAPLLLVSSSDLEFTRKRAAAPIRRRSVQGSVEDIDIGSRRQLSGGRNDGE